DGVAVGEHVHESLEFIDQPADGLFEARVTGDPADLAMEVGVYLREQRASLGVRPDRDLPYPARELLEPHRVVVAQPRHGELDGGRLEGEPEREDLVEVTDADAADDVADARYDADEAEGGEPLQCLARRCAADAVLLGERRFREDRLWSQAVLDDLALHGFVELLGEARRPVADERAHRSGALTGAGHVTSIVTIRGR